jgi:hypothetical protein
VGHPAGRWDEVRRQRNGTTRSTIEATGKALRLAQLDMQMAAKRVEAELSA